MDTNSDDEGVLKRTMTGRCALASISKDVDGRTLYGCKECPVKHHDKELLEHHLYMHYNEFRFLCSICGVGLKRREHLERHTQGHLEVRPHACPECGKAFKRKEHLNIHRSIHSGDKNMNCAICNKAFYRKDHLQKHLQTHNKFYVKGVNDVELVNVKQEPVEFDEKMSSPAENPIDYEEKEILQDDSTSEDDIKMEIDESYIIPDSIEVTVTTPKPSGAKSDARPFACTLCDKTYKRRDHLKLHSLTHMKKENGCDECGKAFHSAELLLDHVGRVHGDDYSAGGGVGGDPGEDSLLVPMHSIIGSQLGPEFVRRIPDATELLNPREPPELRPHECEVCHRKFKRRQHLKVHANVHLKVEPTVWCSLCHAGFYHNQQFEDHHCPGQNPEVCIEDPEQPGTFQLDRRKGNTHTNDFIEVVEIQENIRIVDETRLEMQPEETSIPTPLRVFVCKYCSKPFKRKDHYRIHLHIHTGVKSFFCPYCQKGVLPQGPHEEARAGAREAEAAAEAEAQEAAARPVPHRHAAQEQRQAGDHYTRALQHEAPRAAQHQGAVQDGDVAGQRRAARGHRRPARRPPPASHRRHRVNSSSRKRGVGAHCVGQLGCWQVLGVWDDPCCSDNFFSCHLEVDETEMTRKIGSIGEMAAYVSKASHQYLH